MKQKLLLASLIIILFLSFQVPAFINEFTNTKTLFIFCNVGEGDGAVLITRENVFLIDAGRDSRMVECLSRYLSFWRRNITGVILTHPDADHMNGLNSVIKSYRVKWLFSNFSPNKSGEYRKLYDALVNSGVVVKSFVAGEQITVKNLNYKFEIASLWPLNQHHEYESTNLFSTISTVTINESKFLMLADSEIATQIVNLLEIIKGKGKYLAVKVSHHGSSKNFSYTLMREISPEYAIISVGKNNYGHPGKKVLGLLEKLGIKTLRTDETRDVVFECEKKCALRQ